MRIKLAEKYFALNGAIKPIEYFSYIVPNRANIIYEVLRVKNSTPIFFEQHIDRLFNSTRLLDFTQPKKGKIRGIIAELLRTNPVSENNIRISSVYSTPETYDLLIYFIPSSYPIQSQRENGISLKTLSANRRNPNAKVENAALRESADRIIKESGCYEVLLVDSDGFITEGSRSNIFFIKDDTLYTPPLGMVLGGITRQVLINISKDNGIPVEEEVITLDSLSTFDGAILTGTSPGLLPIATINDYTLDVNPKLIKQLLEKYNTVVQNDIDNWKNSI